MRMSIPIRIRPFAVLIAIMAVTGVLQVCVSHGSAQEPGQDGRKALRSAGLPWYDAEQDDLQAIPQPERSGNWWSEWWEDWLSGWGFAPGSGLWLGVVLKVIFIGGLALVLSLLVYALVKAYLRMEDSRSNDVGEHVQVLTDEARIEQLPFNIRQPNADLLEQARRHYQDGDFNEAVVYLYSYMLLHLDKNRCIRLSKGKTNRQYLSELKRRPRLSNLLERTMILFEEAFFGQHTLQRVDFEASWSELEQFHQTVTEATG